jgi:endogenous inhibitor of DNA gyrase (YacG/DUF329 family)
MPEVKCPTCGQRAPWTADNPYRPFCCERCKLIDLGAWASDGYRIAGDTALDDAEAGQSTDPRDA